MPKSSRSRKRARRYTPHKRNSSRTISPARAHYYGLAIDRCGTRNVNQKKVADYLTIPIDKLPCFFPNGNEDMHQNAKRLSVPDLAKLDACSFSKNQANCVNGNCIMDPTFKQKCTEAVTEFLQKKLAK